MVATGLGSAVLQRTEGGMVTQYELVKEMFRMLDITEESDQGHIFHPITFSCCRVMMHEPFAKILKELKETVSQP